MDDRRTEADEHELLACQVAEDLRLAVNRLRNYGLTLTDVYAGVADELGRTSASLDDEAQLARMLTRFVAAARAAYRHERASGGDILAQRQRRLGIEP